MPLVVMEISGRGSTEAMAATTSTQSGRSSGSPPVRRTSSMPSPTAIRTIRISSSGVNKVVRGSHGTPSAGMQ